MRNTLHATKGTRGRRCASCGRVDERGVALLTTLLLITMMGMLAGAALLASAGSAPIARADDNYSAALSAADAGVDDLMYRLNANENTSFELAENIYDFDSSVRAGTTTTTTTTPATCEDAYTPNLPPAACGWVTIPDDSDSLHTEQYQYSIASDHEPDPTGTATTAGATGSSTIVVDVYGRSVSSNGQSTTRVIRVVLDRSTFLNYGYFTNVETQDPAQYDLDPASPGWPEFGPYGQSAGLTYWNGVQTQATQPKNPYDAALEYCQNYWFEQNPNPDEAGEATAAGVTISSDSRSAHSETSSGYSLNNVCTFTKWETGDTFYGPVRTNDVLFIDGNTHFYGPVVVGTPCNMLTAADPGASSSDCPAGVLGEGSSYTPDALNSDGKGVYWIDADNILSGGTADPSFADVPSYGGTVDLPSQNSDLVTEASDDGCVYYGMTYFNFQSDGEVYVYSPGTQALMAAGTYTPNSGCYTNNASGTYVNLSQRSTLYVAQSGTSTGGDNCLNSTDSDYDFGGLVDSNDYYQDVLAYANNGATSWVYGSQPAVDSQAFACDNGDAWVGGKVSGQVTVGAQNNAVVYQDLTYASSSYSINANNTVTATGTDVLGLEPDNDVVVFHPTTPCAGWSSAPSTTSCVTGTSNTASNYASTDCSTGTESISWVEGQAAPTDCIVQQIDAAILCFNGEYTAENYSFGSGLGTLTEFGSVSQAYRGRLAGTNTGGGYGKQYVYDPRLQDLTPPSFLPPNIFNWTEETWSEVTGQETALVSNNEPVPTTTSTTTTLPAYTIPPTTTTSSTTTTTVGGPTTTTTTTTVPTTTSSTTTTTVSTTTTTTTAPTTTTTTVPTTTTTHPTTTTTTPTTTTAPTTTTTVPTTTTSSTTTTAPTTTTTHPTTTTTTPTTTTSTSTTTTTAAPSYNCSASTSGYTQLGESSFTATAPVPSGSSGAQTAITQAVSHNNTSRFTSGAAQASGDDYVVNMGSAQTVREIEMSVPDYSGDYARGFDVQVSSNGSSWTTVANCSGSGDPEIVSFAAQTDQYLRVILTTGTSPSWWSIEEFLMYH